MKQIIATTWFLLMIIGLRAQTYELHGKIKGLESDSILLIKVKGQGFEGVKIGVDNEAFNYKERIVEPYFIQLFKLKKGNSTGGKIAELLISPGVIHITGTDGDLNSVQVDGSLPDRVLKSYLKEDNLLMKKWGELKIKYDDYVLQKDSVNRKKLAVMLNNINYIERIGLLKKYVSINSKTIVGALIPNFCTLQEFLKSEDYVNLYNSLSVAMQQTDYGQLLYRKSKVER